VVSGMFSRTEPVSSMVAGSTVANPYASAGTTWRSRAAIARRRSAESSPACASRTMSLRAVSACRGRLICRA